MRTIKPEFKKHMLAVAICSLNLVAAEPVFAQSTAEEPEQNDENDYEQIIITAERRSTGLQEIPISASAFSGEMLNERGVDTFEQLQYQIPSVTFVDNGNNKFLNIRGIGISEAAPNQTAGVAVHLDGGYIAREFVYGDAFFDIASVEVLKGPQGTYSGQNASGGAMFINSQKPVIGEQSGFINMEYGNYDRKRAGGAVSFPIADDWAARISVDWESRDSFYNNHGYNPALPAHEWETQPGNLDRSFGRFQLLYSPSYKFEARFIHEVSRNDTDGVTYQYFAAPGTNELPENPRELTYDAPGKRLVTYDRSTLHINWEATEAFRVLANLSYLQSHQRYLTDDDLGAPISELQQSRYFTIDDSYWTGELTLVSLNEGPLEWTVGASFLDYEQHNHLNFLTYNTADLPGTAPDPTLHTELYLYLNTLRANQALFGEIGYDLTSELQVKFGLRYNRDEVGFDNDSFLSAGPVFPEGRDSHFQAPDGFPFPADELLDFSATTGRFVINWTPEDDGLYYFTISRGYKPGGTTPFANEYDSEEVTNFEAGWKGQLLDDAVTASLSAYHMAYDQFQRTFSPDPFNPANSITRNVDGSTIDGLDVQLAGTLYDFRWDMAFAISKGEYGDLDVVYPAGAIDGVNPTEPVLTNLKGQSIDFLPEKSLNAGLSYEGLELSAGRLIPSVRLSYQDEFYTSFYQTQYNLVPSKTLIDVFVAYESDLDWRLEFYAKNITDKQYISNASGGNSGLGMFMLGNPREVGAKLRYVF